MKLHDPGMIRNLAIIGHGHSGKTSLASALLFVAGAVNRLGRVDDGTSVTDFDAEEVEKKISLQLAVAHLDWGRVAARLVRTR